MTKRGVPDTKIPKSKKRDNIFTNEAIMNSRVPNTNSRGADSVETPRRAQYQFKVNGELLKKKEKLGPEANSIQLTKRTNGPLQKDASAGSFIDNNFRSNNDRSPGPISDDMSYTNVLIKEP